METSANPPQSAASPTSPPKSSPDRGLSLRTTFWLAGCGFILVACLSFVAYLRFDLPWVGMVLTLGTLVALIVTWLEHAVARPLERLSRPHVRIRDHAPLMPPMPNGRLTAHEFRRLWRGMRVFHEQMTHARHAHQAAQGQLTHLQRRVRVLETAARGLAATQDLHASAPAMLRDISVLLGVNEVFLVPLRRHCAVPVLGINGTPDWGDAVRATGLQPWDAMLAQDRPLALCLTGLAPEWRSHWSTATLWVVPLVYHGRVQGMLLAFPGSTERTWTGEELAMFQAIAPMLAAALHPPRWSDERKGQTGRHEFDPAYAGDPTETPAEPVRPAATQATPTAAKDEERPRRSKRRRQKQGA